MFFLFCACKIQDILAVQLWYIPIQIMNKLMMALEGNEGSGRSYDQTTHALIFAELKNSQNDPLYGLIPKIRKRLHDDHDIDIPCKRLKKLRIKYRENDYTFDASPAKKSGRPRILSEEDRKSAMTCLTGSNARATTRNHNFQSKSGNMVKIARQTLERVAARSDLVIAEPKVIRISHHSPHHRRMRILYAQYILSLTITKSRQIWYSDEMSFPVTLTPNRKNDIIYCKKGDQSTSNCFRITKGSQQKLCSLWWVVSYDGIQAVHLYKDNLDVPLFHKILRDFLKPAILNQSRSRYKLFKFYHDHCTNSTKLYDPKIMDSICGKGKWLQFAKPVCREHKGWINMPAFNNGRRKIKAHRRRRMVPKLICDCQVDSGEFVPSASPDDNLIEYLNGYLRQIVWETCQSGEEQWTGSLANKIGIVKRAINKLSTNRGAIWRLYDHHLARCRKIVETGGDVT